MNKMNEMINAGYLKYGTDYNIQICDYDTVDYDTVDYDTLDIENLEDLGNVENNIIAERNDSIHDLHLSIVDMNDSWVMLADMVNDQRENLDIASNNIEISKLETDKGVNNLEEASVFVKDKLIMIRNISLIVGGGILGSSGFLLGPIIGVGTVIAGSAMGGAAVAGLNKLSKK